MRRLRALSALAGAAMLLGACAFESQTYVDVPPAVTRPTMPIPTTPATSTTAPVTFPPGLFPASSTTLAVAALPKPVASPRDARAPEPRTDLGIIEIPRIGIKMTMLEGIRLTTLDRGPGHWPGTAMPGKAGNVVVAGHRTSHTKPFRHLEALAPGDEVIFTMPDGRFVYRVVGTEIVTPDRIDITNQTSAKTATLFACHPPGSTKQRIVVHLVLG
ncbi:MAG: sortase [Actinobacteria bacterium]|nr:sortase [Actinomycetota bacterium]